MSVNPLTYGADSCYLAVNLSVTKQQAKTYLEQNGVNVSRVRDYLLQDVEDCEIDNRTIRCTWSDVLTGTATHYVLEIDRHIMRRFGAAIQALADGTAAADLLTRAETQTLMRG